MWISYGRSVAESQHPVGMPHLGLLDYFKYHVAVSGVTDSRKYGLTFEQCFNEWFCCKRCKSFNFRRLFRVCEMNFVDSTGQLEIVDRRGSVFNKKIKWSADIRPAE